MSLITEQFFFYYLTIQDMEVGDPWFAKGMNRVLAVESELCLTPRERYLEDMSVH